MYQYNLSTVISCTRVDRQSTTLYNLKIQEADATLTIFLLGYTYPWREFLRSPKELLVLPFGNDSDPVDMEYNRGKIFIGLYDWTIVIPQGDAVIECLRTLKPQRIDYTMDRMSTLAPELSGSILRSRSWIDKSNLIIETPSDIRMNMLIHRWNNRVSSPELCGYFVLRISPHPLVLCDLGYRCRTVDSTICALRINSININVRVRLVDGDLMHQGRYGQHSPLSPNDPRGRCNSYDPPVGVCV